jgi:hypothetical protein
MEALPIMQKVPTNRRKYNKLVANEMLEDFALRFTSKRARKWSATWIANSALGIVSFLVFSKRWAARLRSLMVRLMRCGLSLPFPPS